MRTRTLLAGACLGAAAFAFIPPNEAAAQSRGGRPERDDAPRVERADADRAAPAPDAGGALGLSAAPSGSERDTLGLLVVSVAPGGPADRAGVDAGSRLAEVNGVSLRSDARAGSTGAAGESDAAVRRLARAVRAVRPGDEVSLRLFRGGRYRVVSVVAPGVPAPDPSEQREALDEPAPAPRPAVRTTTLAAVVDATSQAQSLLRRLASQEEVADGPTADSLAQLQQDLGDVRRRLRALQARASRRAADEADDEPTADVVERPDRGAVGTAGVPGLRLGAVPEELVPYYGDGSEDGLLVLQADASWSPVRAGDVILRVNDAGVTASRLRAAMDGTRSTRLELLRRRRVVTVTLPPRDE